MNEFATDILVVGGGPAGLSAALSAAENSESRVSVIDDNPYLGGQIWRAELAQTKSREAKRLLKKIDQNRIDILSSMKVFGQPGAKKLLAETTTGVFELSFEKLIIATGARERFMPFPNWTLPNVFGAGGLQALVKNGFSVKNKRVVIAGTGPLLLAVAEYLGSKGAIVLMIVEQVKTRKLMKLGLGLWRHPGKLFQALKLQSKVSRIPYLTDAYITSAEGHESLEAINLIQRNHTRRVECDFLACGFHLVPNTELASLFGCLIEDDFVSVDTLQETSVKGVFCAGEPTGIGGLESSLIEGKIAGLAAVEKNAEAKALLSKRQKSLHFANSLNKTFALREELKTLPNESTIVCRCEDVTFEALKNFDCFREAKLQTRCGMGACQGRICGSAANVLFDWKNDSIRPPIFPVKLENLSGN